MRRRTFLKVTAGFGALGTGGCLLDDDEDIPSVVKLTGQFVTRWDVEETVKLPLRRVNDAIYDFDVEWGDGTSESLESQRGTYLD